MKLLIVFALLCVMIPLIITAEEDVLEKRSSWDMGQSPGKRHFSGTNNMGGGQSGGTWTWGKRQFGGTNNMGGGQSGGTWNWGKRQFSGTNNMGGGQSGGAWTWGR